MGAGLARVLPSGGGVAAGSGVEVEPPLAPPAPVGPISAQQAPGVDDDLTITAYAPQESMRPFTPVSNTGYDAVVYPRAVSGDMSARRALARRYAESMHAHFCASLPDGETTLLRLKEAERELMRGETQGAKLRSEFVNIVRRALREQSHAREGESCDIEEVTEYGELLRTCKNQRGVPDVPRTLVRFKRTLPNVSKQEPCRYVMLSASGDFPLVELKF